MIEITLEKHVFKQVLMDILNLCSQITTFTGKLVTGG